MTTRRRGLSASAVLLGAALAGCEIGSRTVGYEPLEAIEPGIEHELELRGTCGDLGVFATDGAESVVLFAAFPGTLREADVGSAILRRTHAAADDAIRLRLTRGEELLTDWCNRDPPAGAIGFESWRPVQGDAQRGVVELEIDPGTPGDGAAVVHMTATDVTFVDEDGAMLSIASLEVGPLAAGD
jgi:hypothetical protein